MFTTALCPDVRKQCWRIVGIVASENGSVVARMGEKRVGTKGAALFYPSDGDRMELIWVPPSYGGRRTSVWIGDASIVLRTVHPPTLDISPLLLGVYSGRIVCVLPYRKSLPFSTLTGIFKRTLSVPLGSLRFKNRKEQSRMKRKTSPLFGRVPKQKASRG